MPFGRQPLVVPEGARYETDQKVARLEFEEEGVDTFVVLHFEAPVTGRPTCLRAPITREIHDTHSGG